MKNRINNFIRKVKIKIANNEQYVSYLRKIGVTIGDDCVVEKTADFGTEPYLIKIGNKVRITKGVRFITHDGGLWVLRNMGLIDSRADKIGVIIIGNNVNIGWNAMIMPGVSIGNNVVIGCGAIVTKDVPNNSVVAGVPAKVIESIEEYCEKNIEKILLTKGMSCIEKKEYLGKIVK